jgi:transcriptional regulator with XRE-family HTH domain
MSDSLHFGELLRALRASAGLSRAKLAKKTRLSGKPISEATIKLLESSERFPSQRVLYSLIHVRELRLTPELIWKNFAYRFLESIEPEMRAEEFETHTRVTVTLTLILRK